MHIPATWSAPNVPQGGTALAAATRAMQAALPGALPLRSVSCVFAAPVAAGDAEIDVEVLRAGRTVAQATATMRTPGSGAGLTAIAVFGASRPGFVFTDVEPPPLPPPETLPSFRDPLPEGVELDGDPFPFWVHHVEGRPVLGHAPWEPYVPETSERAAYQHFDEPPCCPDGTIDPLALVALCDTMPGAVSERMGQPLDLDWYGPSADLTVHVLGTRPLGVAARPQPRPPCGRRVRLGRARALGPRVRPRRVRHPDDDLPLLRPGSRGRRALPPRPARRPAARGRGIRRGRPAVVSGP